MLMLHGYGAEERQFISNKLGSNGILWVLDEVGVDDIGLDELAMEDVGLDEKEWTN